MTNTLDVIMPIGKPGAPAGQDAAELALFNGRPLIVWAAEEALHAGATRILMVAPEGYTEAGAIADQLQQVLQTHHAATGRPVQLVPLVRPVDGPEGWDGLIRTAAQHCHGAQVLLVDPATAMIDGGQITTFAALTLRRAASGFGPVPLLATAGLDWEEALSLPVFTGEDTDLVPAFHHPVTDSCLVFAGRTLLPLPLPDTAVSDLPDQIPFESLTRLLLSVGGKGVKLRFRPVDFRFAGADLPASESLLPGSKLPPVVPHLGRGGLQRSA